MNWKFWKKKEKDNSDWLESMYAYLDEAGKQGLSEKQLREKFVGMGYPDELIERIFKLNDLRGGKMKKEEFEEDEEDEEEEEAEEEEKPKKKIIKEEQKVQAALTEEQVTSIISDHENRIRQLEATLFRLKSI